MAKKKFSIEGAFEQLEDIIEQLSSEENFVFAMTNLFIFYSFSLKPALPQPVHLKKK